jgi:hypothetical protein
MAWDRSSHVRKVANVHLGMHVLPLRVGSWQWFESTGRWILHGAGEDSQYGDLLSSADVGIICEVSVFLETDLSLTCWETIGSGLSTPPELIY